MGRGRAKAKQIKVARRLKYNSGPTTDLTALERELHASRSVGDGDSGYESSFAEDDGDEDDEPYSGSADEDEDDQRPWASGDDR